VSTSQELAAAAQKKWPTRLLCGQAQTSDTAGKFLGRAKDGDGLMGQGSDGRILA